MLGELLLGDLRLHLGGTVQDELAPLLDQTRRLVAVAGVVGRGDAAVELAQLGVVVDGGPQRRVSLRLRQLADELRLLRLLLLEVDGVGLVRQLDLVVVALQLLERAGARRPRERGRLVADRVRLVQVVDLSRTLGDQRVALRLRDVERAPAVLVTEEAVLLAQLGKDAVELLDAAVVLVVYLVQLLREERAGDLLVLLVRAVEDLDGRVLDLHLREHLVEVRGAVAAALRLRLLLGGAVQLLDAARRGLTARILADRHAEDPAGDDGQPAFVLRRDLRLAPHLALAREHRVERLVGEVLPLLERVALQHVVADLVRQHALRSVQVKVVRAHGEDLLQPVLVEGLAGRQLLLGRVVQEVLRVLAALREGVRGLEHARTGDHERQGRQLVLQVERPVVAAGVLQRRVDERVDARADDLRPLVDRAVDVARDAQERAVGRVVLAEAVVDRPVGRREQHLDRVEVHRASLERLVQEGNRQTKRLSEALRYAGVRVKLARQVVQLGGRGHSAGPGDAALRPVPHRACGPEGVGVDERQPVVDAVAPVVVEHGEVGRASRDERDRRLGVRRHRRDVLDVGLQIPDVAGERLRLTVEYVLLLDEVHVLSERRVADTEHLAHRRVVASAGMRREAVLEAEDVGLALESLVVDVVELAVVLGPARADPVGSGVGCVCARVVVNHVGEDTVARRCGLPLNTCHRLEEVDRRLIRDVHVLDVAEEVGYCLVRVVLPSRRQVAEHLVEGAPLRDHLVKSEHQLAVRGLHGRAH